MNRLQAWSLQRLGSADAAPPVRDWHVSYGYYCDSTAYRGPSTWLAGLHYARANRDHNHSTSTTSILDLDSADFETDAEGCTSGGDDRTEDEEIFLEGCQSAGAKRRRNKRRAS